MLLICLLPSISLAKGKTSKQSIADLVGTWVMVGSGGNAGLKLEVNKSKKGEPSCVLAIDGGNEPCSIRRNGNSLAINSQGIASDNGSSIASHVLLAQLNDDVIEGKLFPGTSRVTLYREGSNSQAEAERVNLVQQADEKARQPDPNLIAIGKEIYTHAFGRGCGTCHNIASNSELTIKIKAGTLDRAKFEQILREGKKGMPKSIPEIMRIMSQKTGLTEELAVDALYKYIANK